MAGDLHLTSNGISIYVAAQKDNKAVADDMNHAYMPVGPVGKPTELHLAFPILTFNFTKSPQACKALTAFMLEAENFNPWIAGGAGLSVALPQRLRQEPGLDRRSEAHAVPRRRQAHADAGGLGSLGEKAAAAIADFVVVDMFANYATGREDAKGAIAVAERQAKRIYR